MPSEHVSQKVKSRSGAKRSIVAMMILMLGLGHLVYRWNEFPLRWARLQADMDSLRHPAGTSLKHRILEHGPEDGGLMNCMTYLLAGEARSFTGSKEAIQRAYHAPYTIVFGDEITPVGRSGKYEVLGRDLAGWKLSQTELGSVYFVTRLESEDCL